MHHLDVPEEVKRRSNRPRRRVVLRPIGGRIAAELELQRAITRILAEGLVLARGPGMEIAGELKRQLSADEWREEDHPREPAGSSEGGQFASGGGGGSGEGEGRGGRARGVGAVKSRQVARAAERGAFAMETQSKDGKTELIVRSARTEGIKDFHERPGRDRPPAQYDPRLAELKVFDPGEEYLEHTRAIPKEGFSEKIAPLDRDIIYRGMRAEEYAAFLASGQIKSKGESNIGGEQQGLTYWASDVASAVSYANAFAAWPDKPTFTHPAYVVATKRPAEVRQVPGIGENEVGVARPISKQEVLAVWKGQVYEFRPGRIALREDGTTGAATAPSASVVWLKEQWRARDADDDATEHFGWFSDRLREYLSDKVDHLDTILRQIYAAEEIRHRAAFSSSIKAATGGIDITPVLNATDVRPHINAAMQRSANLVKGITDEFAKRLSQDVIRSATQGQRSADLAKELTANFQWGRKRAKLIARDQVAEFNSQLNKVRQTQVGVEKYQWSTSLDERVRPTHQVLEGQTFRWDEPGPDDGNHPGEAINCRCVARAVIELGG